MDSLIDSRYVQKSKLFLLPLVELKKDNFIKPKGTYIIDENLGITPEDNKLIVPFGKEETSEFNYYETNYILNSKHLSPNDYYETESFRVYVFDLSSLKEDFDRFIKGKYTEFTTKTKSLINIYWGQLRYNKFFPHPKIEAYLSPTMATYEQFQKELNVPLADLLSGGELLNPPDLKKETFRGKQVKHTDLNSAELEN